MPDGPLSPQERASLVERIGKGDPSAEEEFVRLFRDRVFVMALARTRDREAAHELAQDVMMAVVQALRNGQVRESQRLAAFVHGTARNLVNNHLRARGQQPKEDHLPPDLAAADPAESLETAEQVRLVRRALERLDATDRKILLMVLVEGWKLGEIAARLGLTPEAVRQRKSRAVRKVTELVRKLSQNQRHYHITSGA